MSPTKVSTCEVMVLDDATNATVAKLPWRQFPGVLLQGDSLKILHDDLGEAIDALREHDIPGATEVLDDIGARIAELVARYEAALYAAGIELPYSKESRE
jgi:uncharacterized protein DUF6959